MNSSNSTPSLITSNNSTGKVGQHWRCCRTRYSGYARTSYIGDEGGGCVACYNGVAGGSGSSGIVIIRLF